MKTILNLIITILVILITSNNINVNAQDSIVTCEMCTFVVKVASDLVSQRNFTPEEIITNIDYACDYLPTKWSPYCRLIVDQFGLQMIKDLINEETPSKICQQINYCKEFELKDNFSQFDLQLKEVDINNLGFHWKHHHHNPIKKFECHACDYAVKKIESRTLNGQTESEIEKYVDQECNHFEIKQGISICKGIVHSSLKQIMAEVRKHTSPSDICKHTLHMCK